MDKNVSPQIRFYSVLAGAAVFIAALGFVIYSFLVAKIIEEGAAMRKVKIELAELEAKKSQAKEREGELAAAEGDIRLLQAAFFDPQDPLPFFEMMESMASSTGVKMSLKLGEQKKGDGATQEFVVTADGTYAATRSFLALLELAPFEVTVRTIRFQKTQAGFSETTPDVRLTLTFGALLKQ